MNISIFGLGYVGTVSAACLAKAGHHVIGVDINPTKVQLICDGQSPIIEKDLGSLIKTAVKKGTLTAIKSAADAVQKSTVSLLCVGTPSRENGSLDLDIIKQVCAQLGKQLKNKKGFHLVVIRSTMLPGSVQRILIPILEQHSAKKCGTDFGVCFNPEFLREGSAVYDFFHPARTIIGTTHQKSGDILEAIFKNIDAPLIRTSIPIAEMLKYADNSWHALKICFANEIGELCRHADIDSHKVMDIFCQDKKLNISSNYLQPGFAFGGSCLPKDVRALHTFAKHNDLKLPLLSNILRSNQAQIDRCLKIILSTGETNIGLMGISFKAGTDDLRESPMIQIAETLLGKGYHVSIYDRNVQIAGLVGANKEYILNRIPHISGLMVKSKEAIVKMANVIVIGTADPEFLFLESELPPTTTIIDFVRLFTDEKQPKNYQGISW